VLSLVCIQAIERPSIIANPVLPDSGAYYSYNFGRYGAAGVDPDTILIELFQIGCPVTTAWFHGGGGCICPGNTVITGTVVPPYFIVRLERPDPKMDRYDFTQHPGRASLTCVCGVRVATVIGSEAELP
jgi:hypothetical protein